jgi:hypothetical protein
VPQETEDFYSQYAKAKYIEGQCSGSGRRIPNGSEIHYCSLGSGKLFLSCHDDLKSALSIRKAVVVLLEHDDYEDTPWSYFLKIDNTNLILTDEDIIYLNNENGEPIEEDEECEEEELSENETRTRTNGE